MIGIWGIQYLEPDQASQEDQLGAPTDAPPEIQEYLLFALDDMGGVSGQTESLEGACILA
jgi:hypothetical protein